MQQCGRSRGNRFRISLSQTLLFALFISSLPSSALSESQAHATIIESQSPSIQPAKEATAAYTVPSYVYEIDAFAKQALLKGLDLNRFILHYRLEGDKQPKWRLSRYALTQQIGAAGLLAFNTIVTDQLAKSLYTPSKLSINSMRGAYTAALAGDAIAGSSSAFELGSNFMRGRRRKKQGIDQKSANKYFYNMLQEMDDLIVQRENIQEAHRDQRSYELSKEEGKALKLLRDCYLFEYQVFYRDVAGYAAHENTFYALNAAANFVGVAAPILDLKALHHNHFAGPADILFILTGALIMTAPRLSIIADKIARNHAIRQELKRGKLLTENVYDQLRNSRLRIHELYAKAYPEVRLRVGPMIERFSLYDEEAASLGNLLGSEHRHLKHVDKVAVQSDKYGPIIGSTIVAEGVLDTIGHYGFHRRGTSISGLRTANALGLAGGIGGIGGAAISLGVTAKGYIEAKKYLRHLQKAKHTIDDRIQSRLAQLDDLQKQVQELPADH